MVVEGAEEVELSGDVVPGRLGDAVENRPGDLDQGALANFPAGEEITFKYDEMTLATQDLVRVIGREYVALGVVAPDAFVKVNK